MTKLTTPANDRSTYIVTVAFLDEDGSAVVPDSAVWSLRSGGGAIVNSREDVAIASLAASVDIVLSGDDLAYSDGAARVLTVEATYTSDAGVGLPLNDEVRFNITDLQGVEA